MQRTDAIHAVLLAAMSGDLLPASCCCLKIWPLIHFGIPAVSSSVRALHHAFCVYDVLHVLFT